LALTEEVIRYLLIRTDEIPAPVAPKKPTRAEQAEEMQVEEPAEESSEEPAEEPSEESAEEPSEEPAEEPSEEPVEELTEPEAASDRDSEDTDQQEVGE
jgi:serine/threonine-protein kinase